MYCYVYNVSSISCCLKQLKGDVFKICSMALIIGDEDVETSVCLRGVGVLVFFLLEKGDSYLVSFESCLVWEFPMVVEHDGRCVE